VLPPTDIRTSDGRCCLPAYILPLYPRTRLCIQESVSEAKAVLCQNHRHQQLLALLSNTATGFFFWRSVFQNFILEKKHENFVIFPDFS
jgi:hypothetical protein